MRIIAGEFKNRSVSHPGLKRIRATTEFIREMVFNIAGPDRIRDAHFLDLFCGAGSIGLEALSRGAASCTFVDADFRLIKSLDQLIKEWGLADRATAIENDVSKWLANTGAKGNVFDGQARLFSLIYANPPDYGVNSDKIRNTLGALMAAIASAKRLVSTDGVIFLELPRSAICEQPSKSGAASRRTKLKGAADNVAETYFHQFDKPWPNIMRSLAIPLEFPLLDWRLTSSTAVLILGAHTSEHVREVL